MKQYLLISLAIVLMVSVSMCTNGNNGDLANKTVIIHQGRADISRDVCEAKGINGKLLMFWQTGCPGCDAIMPTIQKLERENPSVEFEYINLLTVVGEKRLNELNILPSHTPAVVVDCTALVGVYSEDDYKTIIDAI